MKLADLATDSDWIVWIVFAIFAVLSIILLSGHGSWFISGYNTASNEEKEKYDEKKLCRTMGIGMSIIAILALTMEVLLWQITQKQLLERKAELSYMKSCL